MPVLRDHLGLATVNGKFYTFGGFTHSTHQEPGTDVFEYDPATDTWRQRAPMAAPLGSIGATAIDGKIHVIAGRGPDGKTVDTHAVYDPATDTWSKAAALPKARDHLGVIAVDGKIHVIAGRLGATVDRTGEHDIYDPATNSWSAGPPLLTPRSAVATAFYHGMIMVLGGELAPNTFVENEGFDIKSNRWITLAPMPHGRHGFGGGTIGDAVYFAGGSLGPGGSDLTDQLIMFKLP
jgi:N-acetylneuraminic acid mutarotase